jgi:hypothetical protein
MPTTRDSTYYASQLLKQLQDNRKSQSPVQCIPFEFTTISVFAAGDIYNLCVLPAGCRVIGLSAGSIGGIGTTVANIGDAGDASRYASGSLATAGLGVVLSGKGQGYTPLVDTVVTCTLATTTPTSGVVKGAFLVVPAY